MGLANHKNLHWSAVLSTLGALIYISVPFFRFFQFLDGNVLQMTMVIGYQISVIFWMTGIYLRYKSHLQKTGLFGYVMYLAGHLLIIYWLYNSNFVLNEAKMAFSLMGAVGIILYSSGIMTLGVTVFNVEYLPRIATLFWVIGIVYISTGLDMEWIWLLAAVGMTWCGIYLWIGAPNTKMALSPTVNQPGNHQRFVPLDLFRGLIMIVMAIDHASINSVYINKAHPLEIWNSSIADFFQETVHFLLALLLTFAHPVFSFFWEPV